MTLEIVPCSIQDAKAFVRQHHRHHRPPVSGLFAVAAARGGSVVAVAVVGRPVARGNQDGWTAEVTRLCSIDPPQPNGHASGACSALYAACWRAAKSLGWKRLITYTLDTEPGGSLRGAGWRVVAEVSGRSWSCKSRPRVDKHPTQGKLRWEAA